MRLGAILGPLSGRALPTAFAEQSRQFAAEGFESLWTPQAIGRGFMLADPFVALSVAASVTEGIEIGTAVLQVPLYHPTDLAHRVFSLMQISGERLLFGVGAGSTEHDFNAFDADYESRFSVFDKRLNELRTLFAEGALGDADLSPWPGVQGGPPLLYGTWGKGVERAAAEFDGWIASAHYRTPDEVIASLARYRGAGGGRAIVSTIQLDGKTDLGETRDLLQQFDAAGFDDAVVMLFPGGPSPAEVRALI